MKVIKVDSSNDQGADFQTISLKKVFQELKASVEGKDCQGKDKKDIVKKCENLKIIDDVVHDEVTTCLEVTNDEEDEPRTCKKGCCLLQ